MTKRVSIAGVAREVNRDQKHLVQKQIDDKNAALKNLTKIGKTKDSFENLAAGLGIGTNNLTSTATYGFNPISRNRILLEWIHRGSWLGGVAVDAIADDMTRAGVTMLGDMEPEDEASLRRAATSFGVWNSFNDTIKWANLYGGALAVILIEGQDLSTPLRIETVGKNQFKGLAVLDRWMVEPSLTNIVQDLGPHLGTPKFYKITTQAPALIGQKVHYSRCARFEGVRLPYWQRVSENMWGNSIYERLYDRMLAFDSATTGAAQLVYKAFLRTYKIEGFREIVAGGGEALIGLMKAIQFMRTTQSIEGITLMDLKDEFEGITPQVFSGLSDVLMQLGQQLAGALQMPLVRLFGQSPAGMNATGESDFRNYYDGILQKQNRYMLEPVTTVYRAMAQSEGIPIDESFGVEFNPLWQMSEDEKATVAKTVTETVLSANAAGLISDQDALKELKTVAAKTGVWTSITKESIEAADDVAAPKAETAMGAEGGGETPASEEDPAEPTQKTKE